MHGCSSPPLRQIRILILNYLDDWLILAQSQAVLTSHKTLLLSHLDCLGLRVNSAKIILSPSQWVSFLGTVIHSVQMTATVSAERATTIQRHAASFNEGTAPSTQSFLENAGPYGSSFAGTSVGSAPHATHPVLVEVEGSIRGLASRMPPRNGDSGLCISPGPLEGPLLAKVRHDPRHGTQKEGCHNRCFQQGLGSVVRGQTDLRPVVWRGVGLHINYIEMLAVCQACQFFLPDIRGHHVLIRSDSRAVVSYINHQGGLISKWLCMLANDLLVWVQNNLRSLKAMHVPGKMNRGADMLSRNNVSSEEWTLHPLAVQRIWEVFGRARVDLFASEDNSHCPIFFTKSTDTLAHEWPSLLLYAFPQSLCYCRYSGESGNNGTSWF